jgi:predicted transcriptional regulator
MCVTMLTQMLGPTENAVMQLLWEHGSMTARQLHTALKQQRPIAYTTVKTTADRLCGKGLVTRHALADRARDPYCYTPRVTRAELLALTTLKMCADLGATTADRRAVREALAG